MVKTHFTQEEKYNGAYHEWKEMVIYDYPCKRRIVPFGKLYLFTSMSWIPARGIIFDKMYLMRTVW